MKNSRMSNLHQQSISPWLFALTLISIIFLPVPGIASGHDGQFSGDKQKEIEGIIREFILKNPKVILQSIQDMEAREKHVKTQRIQQALADRNADLINDPGSHVGGNPDGDVTLVEFFDYQCGYCKRVHPTVRKLLKEDGNIRFVYKEFPILGPASVYAARAAIASRTQGKYLEFHNALMELKGPLSEERVLKTAKIVGLDAVKLAKDINLQETDADGVIRLNYRLAEELDINGTPAFIVGNKVIRGAVDLAALKKAVANGRKVKKAKGG